MSQIDNLKKRQEDSESWDEQLITTNDTRLDR